jgi:gas vesicle protein
MEQSKEEKVLDEITTTCSKITDKVYETLKNLQDECKKLYDKIPKKAKKTKKE